MKAITTPSFIAILLTTFSFTLSFGQTGPAGIGSGDGVTSPRNVLWLRADAGTTVTGGKVSAWNDQSGNGFSAIQATGSLQPSFTTSNANLNNQPSINFGPTNANNIHLAIADDALFDGSSEMSFFVVLRTTSTTSIQGFLNKRTGSGVNQSYRFYRDGTDFKGDISDGASFSIGSANSTNYVFSSVYDQSLSGNRLLTYTNSVNAVGTAVTTSLANTNSPLYIGNFNLSDNRSFDGDIAEVIIFNEALSAPERVVLENYLAQKYSISLTTNDIFGNLASYNSSFFIDYGGIGSLDGTIKRSSATSNALTVRESNNTLNGNEYLAFAHDGTAHSGSATSEIAVSADLTTHWARSWYLELNQDGILDGGALSAELVFDFGDAGIAYSGDYSDYVLLYREDLSDDFTRVYAESYSEESGDRVVVSVPSNRLKSGYYTLGEGTPLTSKIWYVFLDGNWADASTWTLDASTAPIFNNPLNEIPGTEDQVIIRSGRNVSIQGATNNITINAIDVRGHLYLTTSTGHQFNTINGTGQITLQGNAGTDNFPSGTTTGNIGFADPDNGGTLIIGGAGDLTLSATRVFKNLIVQKTSNTDKVILASNWTLNGDLTVRNGILQFGDGTTTARSLAVTGNVLVEDNTTSRIGSIATANANAVHSFEIRGNFTNNGKVYFTNRADFASTAARYSPSTTYYTSDDNTGRVNTSFTSPNQDQTVDCNDLTYFSRIIIDKGVDDTYSLFLQASDSANFRLLGRANYDINSNITAATSNLNAFALIKGSVKLDNNIIIPVLNTVVNYAIPSAARLWIDGGYLRKTSGTAIVPYGTLELQEGTLISTVGSGITLRGNGKFKIDGGTATIKAFRTSIDGVSAQGTYEQNGGEVTILGGSGINDDYSLFSLTYTGNVFIMTGGSLKINGRNSLGTGSARGNIFINSDPGNQIVTGGQLIVEPNTTTQYRITSRAPFYNITMRSTSGTSSEVVLVETTSGTGGGIDEPTLAAQALLVLNDLIIEGYSDNHYNNPNGSFGITFSPVTSGTNVNDVYIGGSFYVGRNSTYNAVFGGISPYDDDLDQPTHSNTTYFNQTIATSLIDTIYYGVSAGLGQLELGHMILNRNSGNELRTIARTGNTGSVRFDINGDASILSGTLDQNAYSFRIWGNINNYDRLGTYYDSNATYPTPTGTPAAAQIRFREDPPVIINTEDDAIFGNIRFNVGSASTVELNSDVHIERVEYLNGRIYVKNHTLTIDDIWNINGGGGVFFNNAVADSSFIRVNNTGITGNILVFTDGKASDGGLRLLIKGNTTVEDSVSRVNNISPITFPVGFSPDGGTTFYSRPMQMKVKDFADTGYVQIRVVSGELQTSALAGGEILRHYWRVSHSDFTVLPTVALRGYFRRRTDANIVDLQTGYSGLATYVPGYVQDGGAYTRQYESNPVSDLTDIDTLFQDANSITRFITFNGASSGAEFDQADFSGFTLFNGNFTAGVTTRFIGAPTIYYSRNTSQSNWTNTSAWSLSRDGASAGAYPSVGDIAVLTRDDGGAGDPNTYGAGVFAINNTTGPINIAELVFDDYDPVNNNWISGCPRVIFDTDGSYAAYNSNFGSVRVADTHIGGPTPYQSHGAVIQYNVNSTYSGIFPGGDFGDFNAYQNALVIYAWNGSNGTITLSEDANEYPTLWFEGGNLSNRIINFPNTDVTVNGRTNINGQMIVRVNALNSHTLTFKNVLEIGSGCCATGYFQFPGNATENQTVIVEGDIIFNATNPGRIQLVNNSSTNLHQLIAKGNISVVGTGIFNLGDGTNSNIELLLEGESDQVFSSTASTTPSLYKIVMDKGSDPSNSFTFQDNFNLPNIATTNSQPIEILNGQLIFDDPSIDILLTNVNTGNFYLPNTLNPDATSGSGSLEIKQGKVRVEGDNIGIILDGLLKISGGELDLDDTSNNGNNFIEYSASSNAAIELSSGTLTVGSQLRRSTASTSGIIQYTQTGGIATFGKNAAPTTSRGVFEVLGTGSAFNLDIDEANGDQFTIVRHVNSTTVPTLRLSPASSSIGTESIITLGNGDTPASQTNLGIYSSIALPRIEVVSANITAKTYTVPLEVNVLDIALGATFNANGIDLSIDQALVNNGTFITSGTSTNNQTTYFSSASAQSISGAGSTQFWNFEKSGSGTLTLSNSVTVNNNAYLYNGTLNTDTYAFNIKKDLLHDANHTSASAGPGIVFNGTQQQNLDRSGTGTSYFGVVDLDNASGLIIADTEEDFQVNEKLVLSTGVFDIGGNLLIFPSDATIENGSGGITKDDFNINRMIQTNSSIRDFGVRKYFDAISGGNATFIFPVGLTSYTPIVLNVTDISAGYLTARPVADIPPIAEDLENTGGCSDPDIVDEDNVLQYYWIVKSEGISGLNGSMEMYYDPTTVEITSPYSIINYGPARLFNQDDTWDKVFQTTDFDESEQKISFPLVANNDATLEGIYTAGVTLENNGTSLLCGAAIPDQVPSFTTLASNGTGDFFVDGSYQGGVAPSTGSSADIIVSSGYTLVLDQSNVRTRKITIQSGGTLEIGDGTSNHNLGFVTGEGTIKITSDGSAIAFPTGDYEDFFPDSNCNGGGGLEYAGSGSYSVLSSLPTIRRVIFSGSGERSLPNNTSLKVCDNLEILGSTTLQVADGNSTITVFGDLYKSDAAIFDNGGGNSRIILQGSVAQSISGDFSGSNAFNELQINNSNGLSIINAADATRGISANTDVTVDKALVFTNGKITTNASNLLTLGQAATVSGYSSSRFVNGPLVRSLPPTTTAFVFPVGVGNRYGLMEVINPSGFAGSKDFMVTYNDATSANDLYAISASASSAGIEKASGNEFWRINAVSPASSNLRLYWDGESEVESTIANIRTLRWNGAAWDLLSTVNAPSGSVTSGSLVSGPLSYSEQEVTFGTLDEDTTPLPIELSSFQGTLQDDAVELQWITASEINNEKFIIERSFDLVHFEEIGQQSGQGNSYAATEYYHTDRRPAPGRNYYRLKQIDFDGAFTYSGYVLVEYTQHGLAPSLVVYPNPNRGDALQLRYASQRVEMVNLSIYDISGKLYLQKMVDYEAFSTELTLKIDINLNGGLYIVEIQQGDIQTRTKLLVTD